MRQYTGMAALALLLAACTAGPGGPEGAPVAAAPPQAPAPTQAPEPPPPRRPAEDPSVEVRRTMIIADLLYAARAAVDDNRLLQPAGDNAFDRYLEVLSYEPHNAVAIQGIADIVERYVQLADNDMRMGQYDGARALLDRAASIDADSALVAAGRERLREARQNEMDYFALDPRALARRDQAIKARLEEIGRYIRQAEGATFVITARDDDEGRWIYRIMREAVEGYRLRGNISLGDRPGIRVQLPSP